MFSDAEMNYLRSQPLGRIATVSEKGEPDVAPVAFEFDGKDFYIGSYMMKKTRKYWNIKKGHSKVVFVVDDLVSLDPWTPRGIKIIGRAEIIEPSDQAGDIQIRIIPESSRSWGIESG